MRAPSSSCINTSAPPNHSFLTVSTPSDRSDSTLSFSIMSRLSSWSRDIKHRTTVVKEQVINRPVTPMIDEDTVSLMMEDAQDATTPVRTDRLASLIAFSAVPSLSEQTEHRLGRNFQWKDTPFEKLQHFVEKIWKKLQCPTGIDRQGTFYFFWLIVVTVAFIYNSYSIPLRAAYPYQKADNLLYWLLCDYICDLIYWIDMVVVKPKLRFSWNGIYVTERRRLRNNYLMGTEFKADLISVLPLDIFYIVTGPNPMLRISRLFKISTLWELFYRLDRMTKRPAVPRIAKSLNYMIYMVHCNSCVFYTLSAYEGFGKIPYIVDGQKEINEFPYNLEGNAYIRCFYRAAKLAISVGDDPIPSNVLEYSYNAFCWISGILVFAMLVGQVRDIVATANRNRDNFRRKMDQTLALCQNLKVPKATQDRIRDWFAHTWKEQKTIDENQLIEKLPKKLKADLALSVHFRTLSKVNLFQDCDKGLIRDLVLKLKPVLFLPGDFICRKGEVGKEMYIVSKGTLCVLGANDEVLCTLAEGCVFGEISLLALAGGNRRTANVQSNGYSTLFILSKADLSECLRDYPTTRAILNKKAKQMLKADEDRKTETTAKQDLERITKLNPLGGHPKFFECVAKTMNPQSKVAPILSKILSVDLEGKKRQFTLQEDESDPEEGIEDLVNHWKRPFSRVDFDNPLKRRIGFENNKDF